MIISLPRLFPANSMAPHGEPYNNMSEMIFSYIHSKNRVPLYVSSHVLGHKPGNKEVIGNIKDFDNDQFIVEIESRAAKELVESHRDRIAIRVVSVCSNNDMEYGIRVQAIKRFELELLPEEKGDDNE